MYVISVAARHLKTRSISWIAVALIAVIVLLYLLIISVLEGFKSHYMDKLQSVLAHVSVNVGQMAGGIEKPEDWAAELSKIAPGIKGVTISLETPAMAVFDAASTVGTLRGVDLDCELKYGRIKEMLNPNSLTEFGMHDQGGRPRPGCIVGGSWKKTYDLKIGDRVTFVFTTADATSDEDSTPRTVQFAVIGFYEGKTAYLEQGAYVDRKFLSKQIRAEGKAKTLSLWLNDPNRPDLDDVKKKVHEKISALLKQEGETDRIKLVDVETWQEKDNKFYQAITRENVIMRFIMAIFLALVAFIIFLIFGRLVAEKVRDIGALRALGATPTGINGCFLLQGFFIGALGLILGLVVSYFFIGNVNAIAEFCRIDLYPGEAFGAEKIPHITLPWDVILISVLTLVAAVLGALIPAWRASSLNPVECLRHE
jgi:lipoprotein-releasing system permease protein